MIDMQIAEIARKAGSVLGQMAPYLLFGFLAAGVLSVCISPEFVERHLGGRGFRPVLESDAVRRAVAAVLVRRDPRDGLRSAATGPAAPRPPRFCSPRRKPASTASPSPTPCWGRWSPCSGPIIAFVTGLLGGVLVWLFGEAEARRPRRRAPPHCTEACCTGKGSETSSGGRSSTALSSCPATSAWPC